MRERAAGLMILFFMTADASAEVRAARIARTEGTVEIRETASAPWRAAHARERLRARARLRTGPDAWAVIELSDRNVVRLGERTEILFERGEVRRDRTSGEALLRRREAYDFALSIDRGTVRSGLDALGRGGSYRLTTPIATAGVRGTEFDAKVVPPSSPDEKTRVSFRVDEGEITCSGGVLPRPVVVHEGQTLHVEGTPGVGLESSPRPIETSSDAPSPASADRNLDQVQQDALRTTVSEHPNQNPNPY